MIRSVKLRVLMLGGAIVLLGTSTAMAGVLPRVPTFSGPYAKKDLQVKPSKILYAGDGSGFLAGARLTAHKDAPLSWTSWTANSGQGSGLDWINNCQPTCAAGTFHSYPVSLTVFRARPELHRNVFTRMTVTYTGKLPPGTSQNTQVWKVYAHGNNYIWVVPNQ
jgi:hypothetical protein